MSARSRSWAVPAGVIGARLYHVITDWQLFSDDTARGLQDLAGRPRHLGRDRARRGGRDLGRAATRHPARPLRRLRRARLAARPGHRPAGQLVQPGAVRQADDAAVGAGDRPRAPARRVHAVRDVPPDVPLRGALVPHLVCRVDCDREAVRQQVEGRKPLLVYVAGYTFVRFFIERIRIDEASRLWGLRVNEWVSAVVFLASVAILVMMNLHEPELSTKKRFQTLEAAEAARSSLPLIVWVDVGTPPDEVGDALAEIVLDDVWKSIRTAPCGREPRPRHRRQGVHRPRRAVGLRQDDRAPDGRRARGDHEGTIRIGDRVVNDVPPKERDIAMVFQNYALYPHMTVFDNMAFGLKLQKVPKPRDRRSGCTRRRAILGLDELLDRKPAALSGGQRQRVAMGRAIVRHPQAFLMDEPLSNLDAKLRVQMRSEIARIQQRPRRHDDLRHPRPDRGDDDGRPRRRHPQGRAAAGRRARRRCTSTRCNLFVAGFIGSPAMNLFEATLRTTATAARRSSSVASGCRCRRRCSPPGPRSAATRAGRSPLGIRPEDMEDASLVSDAPADRRITVDRRAARGARLRRARALHGARRPGAHRRREGARPRRRPRRRRSRSRPRAVTPTSSRGSTRAPGRARASRIELVVDTNRLHFFDPDDSSAIYSKYQLRHDKQRTYDR